MSYFSDCMNQEQLKTRYKEWVLKLHPDRHPDDPDAERKFKEMQQEYEEREAELRGDYTKARKGREQREREERERRERERKEEQQRRVERVIQEAKRNRSISFQSLQAKAYIYVRPVFAEDTRRTEEVLKHIVQNGVKDECIIQIETIVQLSDDALLHDNLNALLPEGIWGGYEILQMADPSAGVPKSKRVAKGVMFRSPKYCIIGNPMGDQFIQTFYVPINYESMFSDHLGAIRAAKIREEEERKRLEEETKKRILAEQAPLIEEWSQHLIELSNGLSRNEQQTVARDNLRCILAHKFKGCRFNVGTDKYTGCINISWEDGPTQKEVNDIADLFSAKLPNIETPWMQKFGRISLGSFERRMSTLTKARILQQLGQITSAFRNCEITGEVVLSDFDWMMLHVMVGVDLSTASHNDICRHDYCADGSRFVTPLWATRFIFAHTSYSKPKKSRKKS